jgi:hypothetical protein
MVAEVDVSGHLGSRRNGANEVLSPLDVGEQGVDLGSKSSSALGFRLRDGVGQNIADLGLHRTAVVSRPESELALDLVVQVTNGE